MMGLYRNEKIDLDPKIENQKFLNNERKLPKNKP